jgi:ketosteroid isomerase-like protein
MSNTERFRAYIAAYARKDLAAIDAMLAPDVSLRDWNLSAQGKVAGELKIMVDRSEELHVLDVITFSAQGAIASIRAYLGRTEVARALQAVIDAGRSH